MKRAAVSSSSEDDSNDVSDAFNPSQHDGESSSEEISSLSLSASHDKDGPRRRRPLKRVKRLADAAKHVRYISSGSDESGSEEEEEEDASLSIAAEGYDKDDEEMIEGARERSPRDDISDYDENQLDIEDFEAIAEAEDEEDDDDDDDDDEDSFIVDDNEFENLARVIGTRDSLTQLDQHESLMQENDANNKESTQRSKKSKISRIQEWREDRERRRSARVVKLRELSLTNTNIKKQLERNSHELQRLYGSKKKHHPLGLIGTLFFHQLVAVAWCLLRENIPFKSIFGGILADEMGVGKTTVMLTLIAMDILNGYNSFEQKRRRNSERGFYPPTLVVCPNSLIKNWKNEARARFEPTVMQILILNDTYTTNWRDTVSQQRLVEADVIIINYESLRNAHSVLVTELTADIMRHPADYNDLTPHGQDLQALPMDKLRSTADTLAKKHFLYGFQTIWNDSDRWTPIHFLFGYHFRRIVFDECTHFKNDTTKTFHSIMDLQGERIWALSGTPMENNMDELYALMKSLGVARVARSVSDKARWHHFLRLEQHHKEGNAKSAVHTPSPEVVRRLKRRFLNALQLRREIQNTNTVNPLLNYVIRSNPETEKAWDTFVFARDSAKKERALHRRVTAFVDDAVPDELADTPQAHFNRPLEDLTFERLENGDNESVWKLITKDLSVAEGFYWNTRQHDFCAGYKDVNRWLQESFDTSIEQLSDAVQEARHVMKQRGIAMPTTTAECEAITEAIRNVMDKGESKNTLLRGPMAVLSGFPVPKPLLFASRMHPLEEFIYKSSFRDQGAALAEANRTLNERAAALPIFSQVTFDEHGKPMTSKKKRLQSSAALEEDDETVNKASTALNQTAFEIISRSRSCCADYRAGQHALETLERMRGQIWDMRRWRDPLSGVVIEIPPEPFEMTRGLSLDHDDSEQVSSSSSKKIPAKAIVVVEDEPEVSGNEILEVSDAEAEQAATKLDDIEEADERQCLLPSSTLTQKEYCIPTRLPTKYLMALRYIRSIPKDDKVVIFSDLVQFFPHLRRFLEASGIKTIYITGRQKGAQRDQLIESFKKTDDNSSPRVLLASLKCLSQGHNLQVANHVILWQGWWNGSYEEQAKRRVLRPGQTKQVFIVYLALTGTIDELVMSKAGLKETMINAVIGGYDGVIHTGANFSRPDATKSHAMMFAMNYMGEYLMTPEGYQEQSIDELLRLPPDEQFGKTFEHVQESFLFSKGDAINRVHVAQTLMAIQ